MENAAWLVEDHKAVSELMPLAAELLQNEKEIAQKAQNMAKLAKPNAATDIVALVNDDPHQMYEIRSNNGSASQQLDVGNTADIAYSAGASPNYISRTTLNDSSLSDSASKQIKIAGVSRDPDNNDLTSAGVVWRVVISEHFFKQHVGV